MGTDTEATAALLGSSGLKGSDDETYMDTKWVNSKWRKSTRLPKGKARKIAMGAASIINSWPDHVLFCWLAAVAFAIVMFASILMFLGMAKTGQSFSEQINKDCILRRDKKNYQTELKDFVKMPIHLHLILNDGEYFRPEKYKSVLISTLEHHPGYSINVYVLLNDTTEDYQRNSRFKDWELYNQGIQKHKFFDTISSSMENKVNFAPKIDDPDLVFGNSDIKIVRSTFSNYFEHSPLRYTWKNYHRDLFPLIFKVLTLWEHGGISLPWNMFMDKIEHYSKDQTQEGRLKILVDEFKKQSASDVLKLGVASKQEPTLLKESIQNVVDFGGLNAGLNNFNEMPSELILKPKKKPTMDDFIARGNELLDVIGKPKEEIAGKFNPPKLLEEKIKHLRQLFKDYTDESYSDTSSSESESFYDLSADGLPDSMESHSEELLQMLRKGRNKKKGPIRKKRSIDYDYFHLSGENILDNAKKSTNPKIIAKRKELDSLLSNLDVELSNLNKSISAIDEKLNKNSTENIIQSVKNDTNTNLNQTKYTNENQTNSTFGTEKLVKTIKNDTKRNLNQTNLNENQTNSQFGTEKLDNGKPKVKTIQNDTNAINSLPVIDLQNSTVLENSTMIHNKVLNNIFNISELEDAFIETSLDDILNIENFFNELIKDFNNLTNFNSNTTLEIQESVILPSNASDPNAVIEGSNFILIISNGSTAKNPFEELTGNEEISFDTYKIMKDLFESIPFLQNPIFMLNGAESTDKSWESDESWELSNKAGKNRNHFYESKKFRDYAPFNHYNIFSHPLRDTVSLDRYGYYMAVRRPCHAFLGQVIKDLINTGKHYTDPEKVIPENLKTFCQGKKLDKCLGISII